MRLRIVALVAALAVTHSVTVAQDKKNPPKKEANDRQGQLDAIIKDFVQAQEEAEKAYKSAKTDQDRKAAEDKLPKEKDFLPRVHKLLAGNATDDVAAEALSFAVFGLDSRDDKVFDALAKNFVKSDKINRFVQMSINGAPEGAKPVLEKVLAENSAKDLKGMACYALGNLAFNLEGGKGQKEALLYFERVTKEFATIKVGDDNLAEMARGNLFELKSLAIGMKAPTTECRNLEGKKVSLADHLGKVVVLDIWATWCGPCRAMIPHEREMVEKLKGKPFALISVSADDDKKELEEYLTKDKMPWIHWWDNGGKSELIKQWNVRFFPTIYVIDAQGVIRHKNVRGKDLEAAVEKLLAEGKK